MTVLLIGYPLFPGENEVEQLACIMEVLGLPPQNILEQATRRRLFFGKALPTIQRHTSTYSALMMAF